MSTLFFLITIPFQGCEPEEDPNGLNPPPYCDSCPQVEKPNIYIYPEETIDLNLNIEFPQGGAVVTSVPEYGSGWHVRVEPDGMIDNTYRFLFYESVQPDVWQHEKGWLVQKEQLAVFFSRNLESYGFRGAEISDFTAYWIPRLSGAEYYSIYPQTASLIEEVIHLDFSVAPGQLLRLFYVIEAHSLVPDLLPTEPDPAPSFPRQGYYATEWGVILK